MSGGWAAKELTEKGLKTLVLERGRMVRHPDYPTATKDPWDLPYGNRITQETRQRKPVQSRTGYPTPANQHWFVDDLDNPYVEEQPFDWLRGYHVGGRSLMWARQSYRFSRMDFEANAQGGRGHSLAGDLRRDRAVVRQGGDLRGHQRQRRRPAATARRQIPSAARSQLRRSRFQEAARREAGPQAHHRPLRQSHRAAHAQREPAARHLPVAQHVHSRLSVRRATSAASRPRCRRPSAPAT